MIQRIFWLSILLIWTMTIGLIGMIGWGIIAIVCGFNTADKWLNSLKKTGDPIANRFFNT